MGLGIGAILTAVGLGKSLLDDKEDPYADIRKRTEELLEQMRTRFPQLREIAKSDVSIAADERVNRITDSARAGQMPLNVILQKEGEILREAEREKGRRLATIGQQEQSALRSMAGITAGLPPEAPDTFGEDILTTGIQLLGTGDDPDVLETLKGVLGGGASLVGGDVGLGLKGVSSAIGGNGNEIETILQTLLSQPGADINKILEWLKSMYSGAGTTQPGGIGMTTMQGQSSPGLTL